MPQTLAMPRRRFLALHAAVSVALLAGCATAPPGLPAKIDQGDFGACEKFLDSRIPAEMARWKVPGVSVALVDDQRVVLAKGWGLADVAGQAAATAQTLYRVGSLSKLLTATEVVRRAERGEIQLDGTLSSQLQGFSILNRFADAHPLTVRSLLAHHSGLPASHLKGMWLPQPGSLQALQAQLADEYLAAPPQTQYLYSNLDYSLLGRLVEGKSQAAFPQAMATNLLQPLGMAQSHFEASAQPWVPVAQPYRGGVALTPAGLRDTPAGALLSSAGDMARFMKFVFADGQANGQAVVGARSLAAMFTPQFEGLPLDFGHKMGLGWMLSGVDVGSTNVAWHTGEFPGYFSAILVSRQYRLGVVVLANDENAKKFALEVGKQALAAAISAKTGQEMPLAARAPVRAAQAAELPAQQLERLSGQYMVFGSLSTISRKGNKLLAEIFGTEIDLVPISERRFALQKSLLGLLTLPLDHLSLDFADVQGRRFAVLQGLPAPLPFERIEPQPLPRGWQQRLGTYVCEDGDNNMAFGPLELGVEHGLLVANVRLSSAVWGASDAPVRLALVPVSETEAVIAGAEGMAGSVVAARTLAGVEGIRYSGYFFRKAEAGSTRR